MGNPIKVAELASAIFELVEENEPIMESGVVDSKSLWRSTAEYRRLEPFPFSETRRPQHEYLRLFRKSSKLKMSISGAGFVEIESDPIYRAEDAEATLNFFEHSDARTFDLFRGLLQQRLYVEVLKRRVILVASCLPELRGVIYEHNLLSSDRLQLPAPQPHGVTREQRERGTDEERFDTARKLIESGKVDQGLDVLYGAVDNILYSGDYSTLNDALESTHVAGAPLDFLLGMLTASLPVKTRLAARPAFFAKVKDVLSQQADYKEDLLAGLE